MTTFQLIALVVFLGALAAACGKDIFALVKKWLANLPSPVPAPTQPATSSVKDVVDDLVTVATLRDKFAATNCQEGVDACSILLKIIVDHKHPHVG